MNFMKEPKEDGLYWLYGYDLLDDKPGCASVVEVYTIIFRGSEERVVYIHGDDDSTRLDVIQTQSDVYWYGPLVPPER